MRYQRYLLSLIVVFAALVVPAAASARVRQPKPCVVPHVTGESLTMARRKIDLAGCKVGRIYRPMVVGEKLIVRSESPRPSRRHLKHGTRVSLVLKVEQTTATTPPPTTSTPTTTTPATTALVQTVLDDTVVVQQNYEAQSPADASYLEVNATLIYSTSAEPLLYLVGQPITYTVVDLDTDQTLATFAGTTGTVSTECSIAMSSNYPADTTETLTGESITPYAGATALTACGLGTITFPSADTVVLQASFAGNATYAASDTLSGSVL